MSSDKQAKEKAKTQEMDVDSGAAAAHTQLQQAAELVYVSDSDDCSSSSTSSDETPDADVDDGSHLPSDSAASAVDSGVAAAVPASLPAVKSLVSPRIQASQSSLVAAETPVVSRTVQATQLPALVSLSRSRPTEVLSSPEPVTASKEERVAEAIKILKTKSLSKSRYISTRPASYHFDREAAARRRYDWETQHFYPDVHDIMQSYVSRRPRRRRVVITDNVQYNDSSSDKVQLCSNTQSSSLSSETVVTKSTTTVTESTVVRQQVEVYDVNRHVSTDSGESSSDESTTRRLQRNPASLKRTQLREKPNASNILEVPLVDRVLKAGNASPVVKHRETPRGRKSSPRRHSAPVTYNDVPPPLPLMPPPPSPPLPSPPPTLWPQTFATVPVPILLPHETYLNDVDMYDSTRAKSERLDFLDMINDDMLAKQTHGTKEPPGLLSSRETMPLDRSQEDIAYQKTTDLLAPAQRSKLPGQWTGSLWQESKGSLLEKPAAKLKAPELYGGRGFALSGISSMEDVSRIQQSPVPPPVSSEHDSHFVCQEDLLRENAKNAQSTVSSNFYLSNSTLSVPLGASREYLSPIKSIGTESQPVIDHSKPVKENLVTYGLFRTPARAIEPVEESEPPVTAQPIISKTFAPRSNSSKIAYTIRPVYDQTELDISKPTTPKKVDATPLVSEEKETYREFKVDYVARQLDSDNKPHDSPGDQNSPVQSRPSSRGAGKSQWQLLHERQEAVAFKSPDAMQIPPNDLTMAEVAEAGKLLSLPPAKPAKPLFDADSRVFVIQGVKQPEQKIEKAVVDQLNSSNEVASSVFAVSENIIASSIKSVAMGAEVKPENVRPTSISKKEPERESAFGITAIRKELSASAVQLSYVKPPPTPPQQRYKVEQDDQIFENSEQKTVSDTLITDLSGQSKTPTEAKASLAFPSRQVVEQIKVPTRESSNWQVQKVKDDGRLFVTTGNRSPLLYADEPTNLQDNKKSYYNSVDALDFIPIKQKSAPYMASPLSSVDSEVYHSRAASQYDMYVRDSQEKYRAHVNATIDSLPVTVRKDYAIEAAKEFVYPHKSRVPPGAEHIKPPAAVQLSDRASPAVKLQSSVEQRKHHGGVRQPHKSRPYLEGVLSASQPDISYGQPPARQSFVPYKSPRQPEQTVDAKLVIRSPEKPLSSQVHNETANPPSVPPRYSQSHYQLRDEQVKKLSASNLLQVDTGLRSVGDSGAYYDSYSAFAKPMPSPTSAEVEHYSQMKTTPAHSHSPAGTRVVPYIKPHGLTDDDALVPKRSPSKHNSPQRQSHEHVTALPRASAESSPHAGRNSEKNQSNTSLASGLAKIRSIFEGISAPDHHAKAISVPNLMAPNDEGSEKPHAELGTQPAHHNQRRPTTPRTVKQQQKEIKARSRLAADSQPSQDSFLQPAELPSLPYGHRYVLNLPYDRPTAGSRSSTPVLERSSSVSAIEHGRRSGNSSPTNSSYVLRRATTPGRDDPKSLTMVENIKPRLTVPVRQVKLTREQQAIALNWANTLSRFNARRQQPQQVQEAKPLTESRSPAQKVRKPTVVKSSSLKETVPAAPKSPALQKSTSSTQEREKFDQMTIRVTCRTPVPSGALIIPSKQQKPAHDEYHEEPAAVQHEASAHHEPPHLHTVPALHHAIPVAAPPQLHELPAIHHQEITDAYRNSGISSLYYQQQVAEEKYPHIHYEIPRINFDASVNAVPLEGAVPKVPVVVPVELVVAKDPVKEPAVAKEQQVTLPQVQSVDKPGPARDTMQHEPVLKPTTSVPVQARLVDNQHVKETVKQTEESKVLIESDNEDNEKETENKHQPMNDSSDKENNTDISVNNQINNKKSIESKSLSKLEQRRRAAKAETLVLPTAAQIREKMQAERLKFFTQPPITTSASSLSPPLTTSAIATESNKAAPRSSSESSRLLSPVSIGDASDSESTDMDVLVKQNDPLAFNDHYGKKEYRTESPSTRKVKGQLLPSELSSSQTSRKSQEAEQEENQRKDDSEGGTGVERRASFKDLLSSFEAKTTPYMRGAKRQLHGEGEEESTGKVDG